jgi:hypothetical protein
MGRRQISARDIDQLPASPISIAGTDRLIAVGDLGIHRGATTFDGAERLPASRCSLQVWATKTGSAVRQTDVDAEGALMRRSL